MLQPLRNAPHAAAALNPIQSLTRRTPGRAVIITLVAAGALGACRSTFAGFGMGLRARAGAEQLFDALANRHADLVRNAEYEYARVQLAHGALSPSRIFDDTASWTGLSGQVRILETFGSYADGKYTMASRRGVPAPMKPADARHVTTLSKLSDSEYRWDTTVDYALGSARPADIAAVITRLLAAGENLSEREARADLAAGAPRTAAALGTLFTLDALKPVALVDGTTAVSLTVSVHSEQLKARFPDFGDYARKYLDPARLRFVLTDRAGVPFLSVDGQDRVLNIRLRTQNGHLVPLSGPPRPLPDSLLAQVDFTAKVKLWNVGFHDLVMDLFVGAQGNTERDWTFVAKREPHWNLPMIAARLIRAPLRRPFAGEGALFRIGVRANPGDPQTVLFRQSRLTVQESTILRFINSLSNTAMDDFGQRVEKEENQWLREIFVGMRDDARAAIAVP